MGELCIAAAIFVVAAVLVVMVPLALFSGFGSTVIVVAAAAIVLGAALFAFGLALFNRTPCPCCGTRAAFPSVLLRPFGESGLGNCAQCCLPRGHVPTIRKPDAEDERRSQTASFAAWSAVAEDP